MKKISTGLMFLLAFFAVVCFSGNSIAFVLPDTGQTKCYQGISPYDEIPCAGTGQDGEYNINPLSYTGNGDGTITDNNTDLMWQKEDDGQTYNWYQASGTYDETYNPSSQNVCASLSLGGYSDWRLPSRMELITLVDYGIPFPGPTIAQVFTKTETDYYWSSTSYAAYSYYAWRIFFGDGYVYYIPKDYSGYVRCVRDGWYPTQDFVNNGNGTITDNTTGFMWQQGEPGAMRWNPALSYCAGLDLGGYADWRLPNLKELESLTDDAKYNPSIDTTFFPNANADFYWSSTTRARTSESAWNVYFLTGYTPSFGKEDYDAYVRCVRGGNSTPPVPTCTFTYSDWEVCQPDNTQIRTVISSSPAGCEGMPVISQPCVYVPPKLEVSSLSYNFGSMDVGQCSQTPQQFTLSNTGGVNLTVTSISLSDSTNFSLNLNGGLNLCGVSNPTITSGSFCTVTVAFCPSAAGNFNANLEIASNDPDQKNLSIPIAGTGILQNKGKTAPGRVVIIDGVQILSILGSDYPDDYSHYLMDEIGYVWTRLIQRQIGIFEPFIWSRTFDNEDDYTSVLSALLEKYSNDNRKSGGELVILAHSWGTVMAYTAISKNDKIKVDKFISLGSPLNAQNETVRNTTAKDLAERKIYQIQHPSNVVIWDNFWAKCDPISGNIPAANHNYKVNTVFRDQETGGQTCHSAYYKDFGTWQTILLDVILKTKR